MLIFIEKVTAYDVQKIVIPLSRIYDISSSGYSIFINYESGEMIELEGVYQKKIQTEKVNFDSAEEADKIMRKFYRACFNKSGAFYFGKISNSYNDKEA